MRHFLTEIHCQSCRIWLTKVSSQYPGVGAGLALAHKGDRKGSPLPIEKILTKALAETWQVFTILDLMTLDGQPIGGMANTIDTSISGDGFTTYNGRNR